MKKNIILLLFFASISFALAEDVDLNNQDESELFIGTLELDIVTASYFELVSWCRILDLPESGTRTVLQQRLRDFYDLEAEDSVPADDSSLITIEEASYSSFYNIEDIDEDYFQLNGNVVILMEDNDSQASHKISASRVIFNKNLNIMTASGGVVYEYTKNNNTDIFKGESLSFNLTSWKGVFYSGVSQRESDVEGSNVTFSFMGDEIYRSSDGMIILEDAVITSSNQASPFYHIDAGKIWILGGGEWALQDAVLHIGHIPVLYFPFYFKRGQDFFFNPVLGSRDRVGPFLQTTTYLLGQKEKADSPLSFLQVMDEGDQAVQYDRVGLYLVPVTETESVESASSSSDYFKIMADGYMNLGLFAGIEAGFNDLAFMENLKFTANLGFSREISEDNVPYTFDSETLEYYSVWNTTNLMGKVLPFRFKFLLSFKWSDFTFNFVQYSDSAFNTDFTDRSENFEILDFAGLNDNTNEEDSIASITAFNWNVSGSLRPDLSIPFVDNLSITGIKFNITWANKTDVPEDETDEMITAPLDYFYPSTITFPSFILSLDGTLFPFELNTPEALEAPVYPDINLPWVGEEKEADTRDEQEEDLQAIPAFQDDISIVEDTTTLTQSLKYKLSLNQNIDFLTWDEDITWDDYSYKIEEIPSKIDFKAWMKYSLSLSSGVLSLSNNIDYKQYYKSHIMEWGDILIDQTEFEDEYEEDDRYYSTRGLVDTFSLTTKPLYFFTPMKNSSLTYSLTGDLYTRIYDKDEEVFNITTLEWTEDQIDNHNLKMVLQYNSDYLTPSFSASSKLSPYDFEPDFDLKLAYQWQDLSGDIKFGFDYTLEDEWDYTMVEFNGKYEFEDLLKLSQVLKYNVEDNQFDTSQSLITFSDFNASFIAKLTTPYSWDDVNKNWVAEEESRFLPYQFSLSWKGDYEFDPFWKNRINLSLGVNTGWTMNIQQYTTSALTFKLSLNFSIWDFLDIELSSTSQNLSMWRYIPTLSESLGIDSLETLNIVSDLVKSFNFFDEKERRESSFNLQAISLKMSHDLKDWVLAAEYTGNIELDTTDTETQYDLVSSFSLSVSMKAIPELNTSVDYEGDDEEWTITHE